MAEEAAKIPAGSEGVVAGLFPGEPHAVQGSGWQKVFSMGLRWSHTRAQFIARFLKALPMARVTLWNRWNQRKTNSPVCADAAAGWFNPLWLQIIADVTGKPIVLTEQSGNAGVLGCAVIAAVGSGEYEKLPAGVASIWFTHKGRGTG